MTAFLIILGVLFAVVGLAGCILPVIAGPPFSFLVLICISLAKNWEPFPAGFLLAMALLTAVVMALDYFLPVAGARKFGSDRYGFWGAAVGMLLGILYAPPLGMILGAFLGAVLGEMLAGKETRKALRAGWGVFVGVMTATLLKLIASGIMTFYFFKALIRG